MRVLATYGLLADFKNSTYNVFGLYDNCACDAILMTSNLFDILSKL